MGNLVMIQNIKTFAVKFNERWENLKRKWGKSVKRFFMFLTSLFLIAFVTGPFIYAIYTNDEIMLQLIPLCIFVDIMLLVFACAHYWYDDLYSSLFRATITIISCLTITFIGFALVMGGIAGVTSDSIMTEKAYLEPVHSSDKYLTAEKSQGIAGENYRFAATFEKGKEFVKTNSNNSYVFRIKPGERPYVETYGKSYTGQLFKYNPFNRDSVSYYIVYINEEGLKYITEK